MPESKLQPTSKTPDITDEVRELLSQAAPTFKAAIARKVISSTDSAAAPDAHIEFWAEVTAQDQHDVIKIQNWSIDDLYADTMSPVIEFANAIGDLRGQATIVSQYVEQSQDWEMGATRLFNSMKLLRSFMGTSPQHDELVTLFETVSVSEAPYPLTRKKLNGLLDVLSSMEGRIRFTDEAVDEISETLRVFGFDLNYPVTTASTTTHDV